MFSFFWTSFLAIMAISNPFIVLPPFVGLTKNASSDVVFESAFKSTAIAAAILIVFTLLGDKVLTTLGVSHGALILAGGVLLFVAGFRMTMSTTEEDSDNKTPKKVNPLDFVVFPLGFPIITGPAAISVVLSLMAESNGEMSSYIAMILAIISVMTVIFVACLFGKTVIRFLGTSGINIMQRVVGLLLAAIAVQMMITGVEKTMDAHKKKAETVQQQTSEE